MATTVTLPALGESVTEGTVTQWLKQVGDTVAVDEPLLEISTDKVDTEIPSPVAGVLLEINVAEDETVEVGAVLAVIGEEGESADSDAPADEQAAPAAEEAPADEAPAEENAAPTAEETPAKEAEPDPVAQPEAEPTNSTNATEAEAPAEAQADTAPASGAGTGTAVVLPALGESVTEGTVTQWLKQVGDDVAVDEPLLEISTDKVDTEIPSPIAGTLLEIKVAEDETVEVGAELAIIGVAEAAPATVKESAPAPAAAAEPEAPTQEAAAPAPTPAPTPAAPAPAPAPTPAPAPASAAEAPAAPTTGDSESYVTPIVRKLAKKHGVDLAKVKGTGVGGRIRKQDVLDAAPAKDAAAVSAAPPAVEASALRGKTEKLSRLRKTIATRMLESL
ncbi:MAG: E3 binding domain-containing protein, partial [Propionibacteriales bacterium]|nr:E3 binding domain-containing protein [Propionibacteriales bacterium]